VVAFADMPVPELARWEQQMATYAQQHCTTLANPTLTADSRLATTYYDLMRVMYEIADYTGNVGWHDCALRARAVYRDAYVLRNNGGVPGYWNFTTGLRMDVAQTGSADSARALMLLAENAAYAADTTPLEWTQSADLSREVAYAIVAYINAEALGGVPRARRTALVDQAYGHMDQWFVDFAWTGPAPSVQHFSPFMVALTAQALIRDWEDTADPRLMPTLRRAADWLWTNAWNAATEAMWYDALDRTAYAPDLNLLIAPMYAFLYRQTGEEKYRDQGDALFAGGVRRGWLGGPKQFNQSYSWSFDYVRWRSADSAGTGSAHDAVRAIAPQMLDLATPPAAFVVSGDGFRDAGFGLPWINFMRNGQLLAQARATGLTGAVSLTVPFPTRATTSNVVPGLSAGPVTVIVYNQTGPGDFTAIGSTAVKVSDTTPAPVVSAITPSVVNLAAAPATFTLTGAGFRNLGYGLPWVNFLRGGQLLAQARATALTGTLSLKVPFPTQATTRNTLPGLSAGPVTVVVYNQTGPRNFTAVGSTPLTVTETTSVTGITPSVVTLAAWPATFTVTGAGFRNLGYGLPWVNFMRDGQLIAQSRATALTGTVSLTAPFPTHATTPNVVPGLSAGAVTVFVYNQTGPASYKLIGNTGPLLIAP
jgi:hypothetical protein